MSQFKDAKKFARMMIVQQIHHLRAKLTSVLASNWDIVNDFFIFYFVEKRTKFEWKNQDQEARIFERTARE